MNSVAQGVDVHHGLHSNDAARAFADSAAECRKVAARQTARAIVYRSGAIRRVLDRVDLVAPTGATVLILGETGVGKELFAQAIHDASPRRHRPMIRVSCAALSPTLIDSELFGHERGAFTDAWCRRIGRFEAANGSTLFLDEIGDLSPETQAKLLRVLQEQTIERLGGQASIKVDVRIIAATSRDIEQEVRSGTFREDLFYRLNVFPITVPPLRERPDDIPAIAWTLVEELSARFGKTIDGISSQSLVQLQRYPWPGNVRELRNVIEREMIVTSGPTLTPIVSACARAVSGSPTSALMTGSFARPRRTHSSRDVRTPDSTGEVR
jgi:formate hydrogenlyase transcriptional activator